MSNKNFLNTNMISALGDKNVVKCRTCGGDHWTSKCPWKDTVLAGGKTLEDKKSAVSGINYNLYFIL